MTEPVTLKTIGKHAEVSNQTVEQLLVIPEPSRSTAVVTLLDTIAIGATQAVETDRLIIDHDIAVTGFDDMPTTRHLKPGLTAIVQPIGEVTRAVLSLLLAPLNGEQSAIQPLMLLPDLVIRESSQGYGHVGHEKGALLTVSA